MDIQTDANLEMTVMMIGTGQEIVTKGGTAEVFLLREAIKVLENVPGKILEIETIGEKETLKGIILDHLQGHH